MYCLSCSFETLGRGTKDSFGCVRFPAGRFLEASIRSYGCSATYFSCSAFLGMHRNIFEVAMFPLLVALLAVLALGDDGVYLSVEEARAIPKSRSPVPYEGISLH